MKSVYAYVRVSTVKQGERGSSLQEQRSAIESYARRHDLNIVEWIQEMETAAKQGRRMFTRMLAGIERGKAQGIVLHKIDRGARNLRDWADLGGLIDKGVEIHFAHESLDLHSRGGRLSADIQAVVAADYIRNLRDEVKKGFYGRLKQGFYPLPAPLGYLDRGKAQYKVFDPDRAPIVRQAFELYATGNYSLKALQPEMYRRGLRNRHGNSVSISGLSSILNNPFYIGLIRIERTNEVFQGGHKPLIPKTLFDSVQAVLRGRTAIKIATHEFRFRRLVRCGSCRRYMTGECHKGRYVYYRCHSHTCRKNLLRQEVLERCLAETFADLALDERDVRDLRDDIEKLRAAKPRDREQRIRGMEMQIARCSERLERLTDAFLDGTIEKELFEARKDALLHERRALQDRLSNPDENLSLADKVAQWFELWRIAYVGHGSADAAQLRTIVDSTCSNFFVIGKKPVITLRSPFKEIVNYRKSLNGGPYRGDFRTFATGSLKILTRFVEKEIRKAVNDNEKKEVA